MATADDVLISAAVSRMEGEQEWILRICMAPGCPQRGLGSALITALEQPLFATGARAVHAVLPEGETGAAAVRYCDFSARPRLIFVEKRGPVTPQSTGTLSCSERSCRRRGLWQKVAGVQREKQLIERRLVLPLAHLRTGRPSRSGTAAGGDLRSDKPTRRLSHALPLLSPYAGSPGASA
ncbi:hypothetical protein [Streptomyces sp. NPDC007206]|uniref:hypothetical protein n=1 Tax=Streptomyces sp. NPDC007206 TaxID=3154317 RepID=UPI0033C36613